MKLLVGIGLCLLGSTLAGVLLLCLTALLTNINRLERDE